MFKLIWRSTGFSIYTTIRVLKSNVLGVLPYESECWKTIASIGKKARSVPNQVFAAHT